MTVIKPPALRQNDIIAIAAPAGPPDPVKLEKGVRLLMNSGFRVVIGNHVLTQHGYLAGTDLQRIEEFNSFLSNPNIRAVLCARGGYGSARILNQIEYNTLLNDPKIVIGFSDVTALLMSIRQTTGLITFHGPMCGGIGDSQWSFQQLMNQISGNINCPYAWPEGCSDTGLERLTAFPENTIVTGRVLGGNLSILSTLSGTLWQPRSEPYVLFIEEICEAPYRIDRLLTHLENSGWLTHCSGILLGGFTRCNQRPSDSEPTPSVNDVLTERLSRYHIPVIKNIPAGHMDHNMTIPLGVKIQISGSTILQLEAGVI